MRSRRVQARENDQERGAREGAKVRIKLSQELSLTLSKLNWEWMKRKTKDIRPSFSM